MTLTKLHRQQQEEFETQRAIWQVGDTGYTIASEDYDSDYYDLDYEEPTPFTVTKTNFDTFRNYGIYVTLQCKAFNGTIYPQDRYYALPSRRVFKELADALDSYKSLLLDTKEDLHDKLNRLENAIEIVDNKINDLLKV